ncbi:unnamed protein product [Cylindrotheca closterium]|uniref:Protein kinase domain-containing protein n=1 Tax=Cylindrotheca closterium TaxID=2856 RepID=A0AAD2CW31_9STRA|nr:unnamed protein product [Cylindrotheca closterium]
MKFGKELSQTIEEHHPAWKEFAVDYKGLKKTLPKTQPDHPPVVSLEERSDSPHLSVVSDSEKAGDYSDFWEVFERSQQGLDSFYRHKESWAQLKHATLLTDMAKLRSSENVTTSMVSVQEMKEHLLDFRNEVELVREFLQVNKMAFSKILKKYDKRTFSNVRKSKLVSIMEDQIYLDGAAMDDYLVNINGMIQQLDALLEHKNPTAGQKRKLHDQVLTTTLVEQKAHRALEALEGLSPFFASHTPRLLPSLEREEIDIAGELLGQGKFCSVYEIQKIQLAAHETDEARLLLQQQCLEEREEGYARYAIKQINEHLKPSSKIDGAVDLAIEAKYLSCISHPNIINLVATPTGSTSYFLVLDRLSASLDHCIYKEWQPLVSKLEGKFGVGKITHKHQLAYLWQARLKAMHDVAKGMAHLHEHSIIHRDIKPQNIGMDSKGNAVIFDFGLVKELLPKEKIADNEFKATGRTGTRKYMAPEVVLYKPYGTPVDVYSFAITFWETMTMKSPFDNMSVIQLNSFVLEKEKRPTIPRAWTHELSEMLKRAWAAEPSKRPTSKEICQMIDAEIRFVERTK